MKLRFLLAPALVVGLVVSVIGVTINNPVDRTPAPANIPQEDDLQVVVDAVEARLAESWEKAGLAPVEEAEPLEVLRRLSLALHGTIPSLEEIRVFERELAHPQAGSKTDLLTRWTERMLGDPRFADYFGERLARSLVGTEGGQFIVYRRDRFVSWLSEQLAGNRRWDEIVREVISQQGLWTGEPAVNFITAGVDGGTIDQNKLTGKTVRAFLGQRIDCAQCHDHPFDRWKQTDFEGLAAFYGQANLTLVGIEDKPELEFEIEDRDSLEKRQVAPAVPFHPEWLPKEGTRRSQLAHWITHPENRRFERAMANRVWALLFGVPFKTGIAVDDLPDPPKEPDLLDLLGADFREHNYDLRRLIHVIAASRPFRISSRSDAETEQELELFQDNWCVFPVVRLRPEQLIGAMLQASSAKTIDQNSHLLSRAIRFFREQDFVRDYGDLGADELEERAATVTQALLRMNGRLTREILEPSPLNSTSRIAMLSYDDRECIENCYLICLTRRPDVEELEYFLTQMAEVESKFRSRVVVDLCWSLFNSMEFSWNH